MRPQTAINNSLAEAKIAYSAIGEWVESMRLRGLNSHEYQRMAKARNIFKAIPFCSLNEQSVLIDALVGLGFTLQDHNLVFTEEIYNTNFDIV